MQKLPNISFNCRTLLKTLFSNSYTNHQDLVITMIIWNSFLDLLFAHTFFAGSASHSNHTSTDFRSSTSGEQEHANATNEIRSCLVPPFNGTQLLGGNSLPTCFNGGNCSDTGLLEPCGEKMKCFGTTSDSILGECDCDQTGQKLSQRLLVYHKKTNRCYEIFKQGPCSPGKWVDVNKNWMPRCRPNPCFNASAPEKDIVMFNGTCVEVGTEGPCGRGHVVSFGHNSKSSKFQSERLPLCVSKIGRSVSPIPHRCSPGTYRAMSGLCQPAFVFDFDYD